MRHCLFFIVLWTGTAIGQESITLQHCLDQAQIHELQLAPELASLQKARVNKHFHWCTLLPAFNAGVGMNTSFGRRLDPITNTFATKMINSQTYAVNSSVPLFTGVRYFHQAHLWDISIRQNALLLTARRNDRAVEIIETYVELCKQSVQIELAGKRIEMYRQLQEVQRRMIREGKIAATDTLRNHNSVLNEIILLEKLTHEQTVHTIRLNFQIGLPLADRHTVVIGSVSDIQSKPVLPEQFSIETASNDLMTLEEQLKTDRSTILPSLSLTGSLGTGFSTYNKDNSLSGSPTMSYDRQLSKNLYEGIGFYLSVPIFNKGAWLKTRKMNEVSRNELSQKKELAERLLEKRRLELEQERLSRKALQHQEELIAANLAVIYDKTLLLYKEGKTTYKEVELAFLEWQMKLVDIETIRLDYQQISLYE